MMGREMAQKVGAQDAPDAGPWLPFGATLPPNSTPSEITPEHHWMCLPN